MSSVSQRSSERREAPSPRSWYRREGEADLAEFEAAVQQCDSVLRCWLMSGSDDYLLMLLVRDLPDFERVHKTQLSRLPHVARIQSSFALRDVVRRALPADLLIE